MNILRKTAANTFWLFAAQIVTRATGFVVTVLLARHLGTAGFGLYAFVCAYVGFFVFLTDMGIDVFVTREASCNLKGSEELTGTGIVVKVFLSILAFLLSIGIAFFVGVQPEKVLLIAIASSGMLLAPFTLYAVAFSATLQLHYSAIFEICGKLLLVSLVVSVVSIGCSLPAVFVALVIPGAAVASLNVLYARKLFRPELSFNWPASRRLVIQALPSAGGLFCIQVLMRIDQVMLEWLRGDHELGLYSTGVKCCEALHILPAIVTVSVFPLLSRTAREGHEDDFLRICSLCFKYLSLVLFPLVLLLSVYARDVLAFLFGNDFTPGASALRILCWSVPLVAMGHIMMCAAISSNHLCAMVNLSLWLAVSNVVMNFVLIPKTTVYGGGNGAALATLMSLIGLIAAAHLHAALRPIVLEFFRSCVKPAAALLAPCLLLYFYPLSALEGGILSLALYICVILVLKGVDKVDSEVVRTMAGRDSLL